MGAESEAVMDGLEVECCPACEDQGHHTHLTERWYSNDYGNCVTCRAGHGFRLMSWINRPGQPIKCVLGGRLPAGTA